MTRQLIVVDIETTGLDVNTCWPLDVVAINVETGETLDFAPYITRSALGNADFMAMKINRYYERGVWERMLPDAGATGEKYDELREMLAGNTLGGSNPRFDAAVLSRFIGEPWHHRLADLAAYAAPAMGLPPSELPGLATVCEHLGIVNQCEHCAYYDALATADCFKLLRTRYLTK